MRGRALSPKATLWLLVVAQVALLLALVGVVGYLAHTENETSRTNLRLAMINRESIQRDCADKEELKDVMRTIMQAVIMFNAEASDPELRERVATYRALVAKLNPTACGHPE